MAGLQRLCVTHPSPASNRYSQLLPAPAGRTFGFEFRDLQIPQSSRESQFVHSERTEPDRRLADCTQSTKGQLPLPRFELISKIESQLILHVDLTLVARMSWLHQGDGRLLPAFRANAGGVAGQVVAAADAELVIRRTGEQATVAMPQPRRRDGGEEKEEPERELKMPMALGRTPDLHL